MSELPMDTIVDQFGKEEGLPDEAIAVMKAIYLAFEPLQECKVANGWSDTQLINAGETGRRKGWWVLLINEQSHIRLEITDAGRAAAF